MSVQAVERSVAVYRALLRLYPAEHRAQYGPHMLQVFQDCCRDAYRQRQGEGLQELWLSTALDLLKTAFEERTRRGVRMNRDAFVRLSFLAALVGGLAWTVAFLIMGSRPPGDARGNGLEGVLLSALLLLAFASLGYALSRKRGESRTLAVGATVLSGVGSLIVMSSALLWPQNNMPEGFWPVVWFSYIATCAGYALTGLDSTRTATLRWPGLFLAVSAPSAAFMDTWTERVWLGLPLGLAWLVYGLVRLTRPTRVTTPRPS